jgi:sulfur carrier protein
MQIQLNGERREIPEGMNVSALLEHLGLNATRVAIERNLEILPRAMWGTTPVAEGDRYEIVQFVGGG